jgi:DNA invertase Pin-like site-specific DNA recombinase
MTSDGPTAIAYYRTSSAANVDGDSEQRQRAAVMAYAERAGVTVAAEFYDAAVSGADPIDQRPGFRAVLVALRESGARTIIVETANRFARDLIVQETGWRYLQQLGIELIAADSPGAFLDETPTAVLIRQVLGAVAQFEKAALVAKLRAARDRSDDAGRGRPRQGAQGQPTWHSAPARRRGPQLGLWAAVLASHHRPNEKAPLTTMGG